ncbi:hypothetical protein [Streptomyces chilikensis]|uniref:Uncharacterized protein n=1 Tax=Streptomyces chilikensis TaxID=1194079 RepID=A0ABV3EJD8_9ACTN
MSTTTEGQAVVLHPRNGLTVIAWPTTTHERAAVLREFIGCDFYAAAALGHSLLVWSDAEARHEPNWLATLLASLAQEPRDFHGPVVVTGAQRAGDDTPPLSPELLDIVRQVPAAAGLA